MYIYRERESSTLSSLMCRGRALILCYRLLFISMYLIYIYLTDFCLHISGTLLDVLMQWASCLPVSRARQFFVLLDVYVLLVYDYIYSLSLSPPPVYSHGNCSSVMRHVTNPQFLSCHIRMYVYTQRKRDRQTERKREIHA
jgi:uncharacterized membrane protein (DUF485 family)